MATLMHEALFYPESRFGGFTAVDGTIAFYTCVQSLLTPAARVLDFGCGRGAHEEDDVGLRRELRIMQGHCEKVCGVDVDPAGSSNPFIDEFKQLSPGAQVPYAEATFDLILADCVVEHLSDPAAFFIEMQRLLKPGGHLCLRTSNRWSYVGMASWLIPNALHARVLGRVQANRQDCDVFPTLYRANSVWSLRRWLSRYGFEHAVYGHESEPRYLEFSRVAYSLGVLHQRFAPGFLRPAHFAFARKPQS